MIVRSDDRGVTLVEMAVVMLVSGVILALAAQLVISVTRDTNKAIVTALQKAAKDPEPKLKEYAEKALKELGLKVE